MLKNRGSHIISVLFLFVSVTILGAQVRAGQQPQMVLLGSGRVNNGLDHDTIQAGQQGTFRAIQLRVSGGAVNFLRIVVQYGNGTRSEIQVRSNIPAGGTTRIIDLPGDRRIIKRVDFWYSKANWATLPKDLAFDRDGNMFGVTTSLNPSLVPAILYRINPATGAATKIVNLVGSNTVMGLAFGREGRLYATDFTNNPGLYLIDPKTGFETAIAGLPFGLSSALELANPVPQP